MDKKSSHMTKAETLKFLSKKLGTQVNIPDFFYLSVKELNQDFKSFAKKINQNFKKNEIIIRSSSINEDLSSMSNAGKYDSIIVKNINQQNLKKAITKITKKFESEKDQIIIQKFISKPQISGVIFTRDMNNNAPYYIINYDSSGKTNLVTSGKKNSSIKEAIYYKGKKDIPKKFSKLISLVKKIEIILNNDRLDIEFAIKANKTYLFQCRPLKKNKLNKFNIDIGEVLINIEKKIKKLNDKQPNLIGNTTVFSNMSDWNPAEMIGSKATPLSFSLYSELITNKIWSDQRSKYGYKNVSPHRLMVNLAGSPYIDLRVDFNSFLPKDLPQKIQEKSINYYLKDIKKNPWKHDKIEFELIATCFDFDLSEYFKKFLTKKESNIYIKNLKILTNNLLNKKTSPFYDDLKKIDLLDKKIYTINNLKISPIQKIFYLIQVCKEFGTMPFAGIARTAFVSTKLLRSIVNAKVLNKEELNLFYEGNNTIINDLSYDLVKLNNKKINVKEFLNKYGHLRPSTYSISSLNYKEGFDVYFSKRNKNFKLKKRKKFKLKKISNNKINKLLKVNQLKFDANKLFKFAKLSIEKREESKFKFSKVIDLIFQNLILFAKEINVSRNDLEFMSINTILNAFNNVSVEKIKRQIALEIRISKKNFKVSNLIKLPDVIYSSGHAYQHYKTLNFGNFITNKKVSGNLVLLNTKKFKSKKNIFKDKIILIENADPGYDFIFSYEIKGLITKYGGANSHMAIRCLELQLPSVIGVGDQKFEKLAKKNTIEIDCSKNLINELN